MGYTLLFWLIGLVGLVPMTLLLQSLFPRFLRRTSDNMERGPWSSLLVGVLGVLIALLAANVTGSAHGLGKGIGGLVLIALSVMGVFGMAAAFRSLGGRMYFSMNSPRADLAFPSTLLGGAVLWLSGLVPGLGQAVLSVACAMGLGAGLIALMGKKEKPAPPPAAVA
jgi:hypothetical protein